MNKLSFASLLILLLPLAASANDLIRIHSLNYPVWIERGSQVIPLLPGSSLSKGDIVKTGRSGRAWLSMADGSVIKLGESAQFNISAAGYREQGNDSVLNAALNVIKGAFRFTTALFEPRRKSRHEVNIKVGAITAGVRGTDIWGRADSQQDFIALLEGSISVEAEGENRVQLSSPLSLYSKQRGQPADPLGVIDAERVQALAEETELSPLLGIASLDGDYQLVLAALRDPGNTRRALQRFQSSGYALQSKVVDKDGEQFVRLFIGGLQSLQSARNLQRRITDEFGLQNLWINKTR